MKSEVGPSRLEAGHLFQAPESGLARWLWVCKSGLGGG